MSIHRIARVRQYSKRLSKIRRRELNIMAREVGRSANRVLFDGLEGFDLPGGSGHRPSAVSIDEHPFRADIDPADKTKIKVGLDRGTGVLADIIRILFTTRLFTTPDTVEVTEDSFVYYEIQRIQEVTIEATLKVSPTYPDWSPVGLPVGVSSARPGADVSERFNIVIGVAKFKNGRITKWRQEKFDHIEIEPNPTYLKYGNGFLLWDPGPVTGISGLENTVLAIPADTNSVVTYQYKTVAAPGGGEEFFMELSSAQQDDEVLFFNDVCHIKTDSDKRLIHLFDRVAHEVTKARRYETGLFGSSFRWDTSNANTSTRTVPTTPSNTDLRDLIATLARDLVRVREFKSA